jgi:hypothetical protein
LFPFDCDNAECSATVKRNDYLAANHDAVDTNEKPIAMQASEDIESIVQTSIVEFIEDLHPHEGVEHDGPSVLLRVVEEVLARTEVENQSDC